jgi:hypothetical protein
MISHAPRPIPFGAVLVLLLLLAAGCGGSTSARIATSEAPPIDEHLGRVLPGGIQFALRVDLEQLRSSQVWDAIRLLGEHEDFAEFRGRTGVDPLLEADELLLVAAERKGKADHAAFAVKGRFDAEAVISRLLSADGGTATEVRGRPAVLVEDMLVVALTRRTVLAGTPSAVEESLAAAFDGERSLAEDSEFSPVTESTKAVAVRFRHGAVAPDFSRFGARRMPLDGLDQVLALDAHLSVEHGLSGSLVFTCATRLEASSLAKDLRATKRDLAQNPIALLLGVDWLFEKVTISTEGQVTEVTLALTDDDLLQIRRLIERLEKIRELTGDSDPAPEER